MDATRLRELIEEIAAGRCSTEAALERLRTLPFADLGFAHVDHHRALRTGFPEVVLGEWKTAEQIIAIIRELAKGGVNLLATRLDAEKGGEVIAACGGEYDRTSRTFVLKQREIENVGRGTIAVVSAGTSDLPVAEEAAISATMMGNEIVRIYDVGVAGIHRLMNHRATIDGAEVVIVCAGMEGALASVVGGLVARPVIAVPTSVGYGASFGGVAALLAMLNSCASNVSVVNIDNGFGAASVASLINRKRGEAP
ncbi:MAG: nickel pincer cofactor biosynthesis protein LarB [Deltaproteobacteria bacterium]|nr:nickel pincer cofactor biosynthesis protein LarB [Deltaproteobacteria bacterium]